MRLYWRFALVAAMVLTSATIASAQVQLNISMAYAWSYDSSGNTSTLPSVAVPGSTGTLSQVNLSSGGAFVNHVFNVYATVTGLASDQDLTLAIFGGSLTGGATAGTYTPNTYSIDPPPMGSPSSDAPAATWYESNQFHASTTNPAQTGYIVRVATGTSTGGDQGNTYGDYAAALQLGESGPFLIGQQVLTSNGAGGYNLLVAPNPGYLEVINGNIAGAAANAFAENYPTYTGIGDSVLFAPRNSTDLTWADGTTANWGVADGAKNWIQTASPSTQDDFYHLDTVRFTDNAVTNRTVTLVGNLNPAAVIVNSATDYTFTGSGAIVGTGTTLLKQGAGKLTISNTGTNAYTGLTTVQGGSLVLSGPGARNPVLNLGGADVQQARSTLVFDYSGAGDSTPASTIAGLLTASYDGGKWDTGKFRSSTAVANGTTLGWKDDLTGKQVTVMDTLPGDVNLDGSTDFNDLNIVLAHYNTSGDTWSTGDVNYDGHTDFNDLNIVLARYNQSLPAGALNGAGLDAAAIGLLAAHGITVVPEPGTLALLAAGLVGLLAYAWRKRK